MTSPSRRSNRRLVFAFMLAAVSMLLAANVVLGAPNNHVGATKQTSQPAHAESGQQKPLKFPLDACLVYPPNDFGVSSREELKVVGEELVVQADGSEESYFLVYYPDQSRKKPPKRLAKAEANLVFRVCGQKPYSPRISWASDREKENTNVIAQRGRGKGRGNQ